MFGYVVINKPELKFKEFDIYKGYYCGLCHTLKKRYGIRGQFTLTYDMTFLSMLLTALYEPEVFQEQHRCMAHPTKKHLMISSKYTDYVADMNVLLAHFKAIDDWKDDHNVLKLAFSKLLKWNNSDYKQKADNIAHLLDELSRCEQKNEQSIDVVSGIFGKIMAVLFVPVNDCWSTTLERMGFFLGKYIYILDAYKDLEKDIKKNSYNPFKSICNDEGFDDKIKQMLTMMIAECTKEFESLPILENANILRNILYAGVWTKYYE